MKTREEAAAVWSGRVVMMEWAGGLSGGGENCQIAGLF